MTTSVAQQRLLDAAVDAFAENGFHGTTTRDIAARAGRSPAALYIHHPSKEHLLFAISLQGHEACLMALEQAADSQRDPIRRLWQMVHDFSLWHTTNAKIGRVVQYEFRSLEEDHRELVVAVRRRFHEVMVNALQSGTASGVFETNNLHATARALLSLGIDLARWFDPELDRNADEIATNNADLAVRMLQPAHHRSTGDAG